MLKTTRDLQVQIIKTGKQLLHYGLLYWLSEINLLT